MATMSSVEVVLKRIARSPALFTLIIYALLIVIEN